MEPSSALRCRPRRLVVVHRLLEDIQHRGHRVDKTYLEYGRAFARQDKVPIWATPHFRSVHAPPKMLRSPFMAERGVPIAMRRAEEAATLLPILFLLSSIPQSPLAPRHRLRCLGVCGAWRPLLCGAICSGATTPVRPLVTTQYQRLVDQCG